MAWIWKWIYTLKLFILHFSSRWHSDRFWSWWHCVCLLHDNLLLPPSNLGEVEGGGPSLYFPLDYSWYPNILEWIHLVYSGRGLGVFCLHHSFSAGGKVWCVQILKLGARDYSSSMCLKWLIIIVSRWSLTTTKCWRERIYPSQKVRWILHPNVRGKGRN